LTQSSITYFADDPHFVQPDNYRWTRRRGLIAMDLRKLWRGTGTDHSLALRIHPVCRRAAMIARAISEGGGRLVSGLGLAS
jgi:hypothetical protein